MAYSGYGGGYGYDASAYGGGYGASAYGASAYGGGYGGGYGGAPVDEIRTIFITGFPDDVKERELNNLLRFVPGYCASQMNWKNGQGQGFALFDSAAGAAAACSMIAGVQFDEQAVLRCEIARKNMFASNDPVVPGGVKRQRIGGGGGFGAPYSAPLPYGGPPPPMAMGGGGGGGGAPGMGPNGTTFVIYTAEDGPVAPVEPVSYQPVANNNDNPPCNTLFVGNIGDNVDEQELRGAFASQPGFRQLKVVRSARSVTAFVEYQEVSHAMAVHQKMQGAVLSTSDRGGLRVQFSKNPLGRRT